MDNCGSDSEVELPSGQAQLATVNERGRSLCGGDGVKEQGAPVFPVGVHASNKQDCCETSQGPTTRQADARFRPFCGNLMVSYLDSIYPPSAAECLSKIPVSSTTCKYMYMH